MMKECDIGWIWSKVWVQGGRAMKQMKSFQKQRGPADVYKVGGIPWGVTGNWNLIFLKTLRYPGGGLIWLMPKQGVQWRWKFSPRLPGKKKRIFGNDGGCLKPEDFPRWCIPITGFTAVLLS